MKWFMFFYCWAATSLLFAQSSGTQSFEQLLNQRQYYKVLNRVDSLFRAGKKSAELFYYAGRANEGVMRYNKAYQYYKKWYEQDTTSQEARFILARASNQAGHRSEAIKRYEELAEENPFDFTVNYSLGRLYQQNGSYAKAWAAYDRQLKVDSNNVTLLTLVGDCQSEGLQSLAFSNYLKAFDLDKQNSQLAIKTANLLFSNKDFIPYFGEAVEKMLDSAIHYAPSMKALQQSLGILKYSTRRYKECEQIFTRLTEAKDTSKLTVKYLALSLYQQKKYQQAVDWLKRANQLYRDKNGMLTDLDLAVKYGDALCAIKFYPKVLDVLEEIEMMLQPDERLLSQVEMLKGVAYVYTGRREEAKLAYWQAYKQNPNNPSALANLVYIWGSGDVELDEVELKGEARKKACYVHILFLQKVKENPDKDTQHAYSRKFLEKVVEEMFFNNEKQLRTLDPDGKEHVFPADEIRILIRK